MKIGLLPLDSRPVCLNWPRQVAAFAGWTLLTPPDALLQSTSLKHPVSLVPLLAWMREVQADVWVWAVDLVAYGGLIPSRLGFEEADYCQDRLTQAFNAMGSAPGYAFSSVLRIPNYNLAEEEPDYWASYGQALYQFSERQAQGLRPMTKELPDSVVQDFLRRRARNFAVNQWLVAQQPVQPSLRYLVFCQDDTGPVGLNVTEANTLAAMLSPEVGLVKTGADELATCLLVRAMVADRRPTVNVIYGDPAMADTVMPFDSVPLSQVVASTMALCGADRVETDKADITWLIHGARQPGDHMENRIAGGTETSLSVVQDWLTDNDLTHNHNICLADVAYANGGDPALTDWLVNTGQWQRLSGYAAWNTPGNALGSSLAMSLAHHLAGDPLDAGLFQHALLTRLLDDGIYQGILRAQGRQRFNACDDAASSWLHQAFQPYLDKLGLVQPGLGTSVAFSWPCQRWFEIAVRFVTVSRQP